MKKNRKPITTGKAVAPATATVVEEFTQLAPGVWAINGGAEVYALNREVFVPILGGNNGKEISIAVNDKEMAPIWSWGNNNLLPQEREALLMDNNLVPELIATKMAVVLGSGRIFYRKSYEEGKEVITEVEPPQWWLDLEARTKATTRMDFDDLFEIASKNMFIHANAFVEFLRSKDGKLYSLEAWETCCTRAGKQNAKGYVEKYYWCGNWEFYQNKRKEFPVMMTDAYNWSDFGEGMNTQPKFLLHIMDNLLHDGYYGVPGYWGGRKWISASNKIPIFHDSNIDNGYFIKLHVEMPADYFADKTAMAQAKNEKEFEEYASRESQARAEFIKKVNNLFSGASGNKVIFTEYEINKQLGKDYPGIKINVLETNKLDESMLSLFDKGNEAVISSQGIHPALASIQTQGKLSSGSELRNALNIYVALKAPRYRRMLGKVYELAKKINAPAGDADILMGFRDIEVTNLDVQPMGMEAQPVG